VKDDRLRNPEFNTIDDPALAAPNASPTEAGHHRYVTLYDRLLAAAIQGLSSHAGEAAYQSAAVLANDAHRSAIAALEQRDHARDCVHTNIKAQNLKPEIQEDVRATYDASFDAEDASLLAILEGREG